MPLQHREIIGKTYLVNLRSFYLYHYPVAVPVQSFTLALVFPQIVGDTARPAAN